MCPFLLLATLVAGQLPPLEGDPALVEYLRDAQTSNLASLRSGKMKVAVKLTNDDQIAELEADLEWAGSDIHWKYRLSDPDGLFEQGKRQAGPLSELPWEYMMITSDKIYMYVAQQRRLYIDYAKHFNFAYMELIPIHCWYRCCSPFLGHAGGRPWVEMIGPHPAFPPLPGMKYRISREGGDVIRQIREDPDGGLLEAVFSVDLCGNVVRASYLSKSKTSPSFWLTQDWKRRSDGVCVLSSCDYREGFVPRRVDARFRYQLTVSGVDLVTVPRSRFSLSAFTSLAPKNTIVQDRTTNRSSLINPEAPLPTSLLEELAKTVRSRGFAKPD